MNSKTILGLVIGVVLGALVTFYVAGGDSGMMGGGSASSSEGATLAAVKASDVLTCGVSQGVSGFSSPDSSNNWTGIDVDFCRSIAAAVLGDSTKVRFTPVSAVARFPALTAGEIDVLTRNSTYTFGRDAELGIDFVGIMYYDGQGFMVRKSMGVKSALELSGASICANAGTTTEQNVTDYFRQHKMKFELVTFTDFNEVLGAYEAGRCDIYTTDRSSVAGARLKLENPDAHVILPEVISKEPLGPAVRHGDNQWGDIVRWTLNALLTAEELGVTQANVDRMIASSDVPAIRRLLGVEGDMGAKLGLDSQWAVRIIKAFGNYGEIYDRHLGPKTPLNLKRGINALVTDGGWQYSPPIR